MASSIFEQLKVDATQKAKLKDVEKKQMEISEENEKQLTQYEQTLANMLDGKQDVDVKNLSALEKGIERGKQFQTEISDLARSLTMEFDELGQFFGDLQQYKGAEV